MLYLFSVFLAFASVPVVLSKASCSSTTTVTTSLRGSGIHCDLECIEVEAPPCSPGQLPTPPPAIHTTTSGCTVNIVTDAAPACGPCATCVLEPTPTINARATHHSSCSSTSTVSTSIAPLFQCLIECVPGNLPTCSPGKLPTTTPAVQTTTSGCTVSVVTDAPECGNCPTCVIPVKARKTTAPPCPRPTTTISVQASATEICACPFAPETCPGGGTPTVKPATVVTKTSACTASIITERPDCSFICPSCPV